jgi:hypothetical protein
VCSLDSRKSLSGMKLRIGITRSKL